jgi:hypothetical protein
MRPRYATLLYPARVLPGYGLCHGLAGYEAVVLRSAATRDPNIKETVSRKIAMLLLVSLER